MFHDRTLLIVRGAPGSAKSFLARGLAPNANYSADDFFEKDGGYNFDRALIGEAHASCQERTEEAMARGESVIAVHNTFSKAWEAQFYFSLAPNYDYTVFVIECQNDFGNTHGVPEDIIQQMHERWEPLNRPKTPLTTILRLRFWDAWYDLKRKVRG
jgi:predicted kinase